MSIVEKIEILRQCEELIKEIIVLCHKELDIGQQIEIYPNNEFLFKRLRDTVTRKAALQKEVDLLQKKIL